LEDILENDIIKWKQNSIGTVYLLRMTNELLAVIAYDNNKTILLSKSFTYFSEKNKKKVHKEARSYFNNVAEALRKKDLSLLENLF
jgi:hypothetical protein